MSSDVGPRNRAYVGFVTTPKYFDDVVQQFLAVAPSGVGVMQRVLHVPEYGYGLDERARTFGLLEEAAHALADSHCQIVAQTGTNWVHCQGTTGPAEIEAFCASVEERTGVPFVMAGHCIVEALRELGAERLELLKRRRVRRVVLAEGRVSCR